jgi:hypothetical protein
LTERQGFLAIAGLAAALPANTSCPPRNPDGIAAGDELAQWAKDRVYEFFPYQANWETGYDVTYSKDLYATFNGTVCNFETFKGIYKRVYPLLSDGFAGTFKHGFLSVVAVPNAGDRGGFVTMTGWEGGFMGGDKNRPLNTTDAAFMVIREEEDCSRKVIEMREISNLGKFSF